MDYSFNYEEALLRLNRQQCEVDLLRNGVNNSDKIPNTITDKQVCNNFETVNLYLNLL